MTVFRRVRLGFAWWTVALGSADELEEAYPGVLGKGNVGRCSYDLRLILVVTTDDQTYNIDTLLHEMIHVVFSELGEMRVRRGTNQMIKVLKRAGMLNES